MTTTQVRPAMPGELSTVEVDGLESCHVNHDVVVVVRMFNEATVVGDVVRDLRRSFPHVLCVDDGSTDTSVFQASEAGAEVVRHPVNLGGGAAFQTGIDFALRRFPAAQYVLTFDADGQHQVVDALRLVQKIRTGDCDVVIGSRFLGSNSSMPFLRRHLLRLGTAFTRVTTGLPLTDTHNGLRAFSRQAARQLDVRLSGMAYASEILAMVARRRMKVCEVPVTILYTDYSRKKGQPGINAFNIVFDLLLQRLV